MLQNDAKSTKKALDEEKSIIIQVDQVHYGLFEIKIQIIKCDKDHL